MLENLIKYFVYATKGYITKTQLIKFLYLGRSLCGQMDRQAAY
jgi:hypothetical protein